MWAPYSWRVRAAAAPVGDLFVRPLGVLCGSEEEEYGGSGSLQACDFGLELSPIGNGIDAGQLGA